MAGLSGEKREPKGRFSISIPRSAVKQLDSIAEVRGSKRGAVVREAVLDWLCRFYQQRQAS